MKRYEFKKRNEVVNFLGGDFKYYIPRLAQVMENTKEKDKYFVIEISDSNKIDCCYIEKNINARDGYTLDCEFFYDSKRAYDFYTKELGEENYTNWLEMNKYLFE